MTERDAGATGGPRREGQPTRGFLFADLRGYTAYVERHGAAAAADVLTRYRVLVRAAIDDYRGAEIRTEGDSFYVVFPAVSGAVECAISIVDRVANGMGDLPAPGVGVGVGVHAGETVETPEGYVGSAVNVAARLCALARPGEVLVSDTVRALTANVIATPFVARGRRRLKGITDPVAVYSVGGVRATPRRRTIRPVALLPAGATIAALLVITIALLATSLPGASAASPTSRVASQTAAGTGVSASPSRTPRATPTAQPLDARELALLEHVPPLHRPTCTSGPGVVGKAQLVCPVEGVGRVTYIHFDNREAMQVEYDRLYKVLGREAPGIPTCREGPYERQYVGAAGTQSGRVVCYEQTAQPNVVWTDDGLAVITDLATDNGTLEGLYRRWQEGVGGPLP